MLPKRKPTRLKGFDYSSDRFYFVTICVQDMRCQLGHVSDGQMHLNEYGQIAQRQWLWLAEQYPYVDLYEFVIMPNHMHGIIEIDSRQIPASVGEVSEPPLQKPMKIKPLYELMGAYKTTSSKLIHCAGLSDFKWQRTFHDHIIRNMADFGRIAAYIDNNPQRWTEDRFYEF